MTNVPDDQDEAEEAPFETEEEAAADEAACEHLRGLVEALGPEQVKAFSLYASRLYEEEEAEEDTWCEANADAILAEFEAAAQGEVEMKPLREVAAELGIDLEAARGAPPLPNGPVGTKGHALRMTYDLTSEHILQLIGYAEGLLA